jgi:Methyltransferase domain
MSEFDPSSRKKLTLRDRDRFPDDTLFHKLGRVLCEAECLPRRELFEAWAVTRRARRRLRGGRVVDLACGHGLVAWLMLLIDDSSASAIAVDTRLPGSAQRVSDALSRAWPRLAGRVTLEQRPLAEVTLESTDVVVATHACGALTDVVIDRALSVGARLAVLPCCHDAETCDAGALLGWLDLETAVDVTRVAKLRARGYTVFTHEIPRTITAKNRLLIAVPGSVLPEDHQRTEQ